MLLQAITRFDRGNRSYDQGYFDRVYDFDFEQSGVAGGLAMFLLVLLVQLGICLLLRQITCRRSALLLGRADEPDE
ncbi:MAG UNVERIFIED_CONTAM: hypothetical protein LVR18_08960 [Planctomycetaceae bacterium]|jgi:hypothetical protein